MKCIAITSFTKEQPGFLDFSYRIKALRKRFELTIVSNIPLHQAELQVDDAEYIVLAEGDQRLGWFRYLWKCSRLIKEREPDCTVLLHSIVAPIAMLNRDIPTALYWNDHPTHIAPQPTSFSPFKEASRWIVRWLMFEGARQSTLIMPIGEAHAKDLLAHGCSQAKMKLIYMGVDHSFMVTEKSQVHRERDAPLELVHIGTVNKARGRDVMLDAMAMVNKTGRIARLTIIGANSEQVRHCNAYAKKIGISADINACGRIPGYAIPAVLAKSDAGICLLEDKLWRRFNPPTKLFEYLVAGLPVLASNIRTHTQYIVHGHNGLVFKYGSTGLAVEITKLWQVRGELPEFKRRAAQSGKTYLWDKIEPRFLCAVISIIGR